MLRSQKHIWASHFKACLFLGVCAIHAVLSDDTQAQAIQNLTCTQLDPALGGTPLVNTAADVNVTVNVGDRLILDNPLGVGLGVFATPPGGVLTAFNSPIVINIGPGQAGVWIIASGANITCAVANTPRVKSNTTDGLFTTFMRVGAPILDPIDIPEPVARTYKPARVPPMKFATGVATTDPFYETFARGHEPQAFGANDTGSSPSQFDFKLDLRSVMAKSKAKDASRYGGMDSADDVYQSRWNGWVSGRYVEFDDDNISADRDGHLWRVTSGLSYQIGERTVIGAFSRVRMGEVRSVALNALLDSDFYGGGAFVKTQLAGGIGLTGAVAFEAGENDIVIQGARGSFDSDQWTLDGRIDKRFTHGLYWIEPMLNLLYTTVERDGYTDTSGAVIAASDLELGRLTYGPRIGTTIQSQRARIMPFMHVHGVWDFVNSGDFQLAGGAVISNADTALNLGGGVEMAFNNGAVVKLVGDWFGFEDDLEAWSITGTLGMPLSIFGIGNGAAANLVSLDLKGNDQGTSAKARLKIPLN